jgi:hypothetical protein
VVVAGLTTIMDEVALVLQAYASVPMAVKVEELPAQTKSFDALTKRTGLGVTKINWVKEEVQPLAPAAVTVYCDVVVGLTEIPGARVPSLQVYVKAPKAVKLVTTPSQMCVLVVMIPMLGAGLSTTATVALPLQMPVLPLTVYIVDVAGIADNVFCMLSPGIHTNDEAPATVRTDCSPGHIKVDEAVSVKGNGTTLTVSATVVVPQVFAPATV